MSAFQIDVGNLNHVAMQLRSYIYEERPQSFASVYPLFKRLQKKAEEIYKLPYDAPDIERYAIKEQIERFGFR